MASLNVPPHASHYPAALRAFLIVNVQGLPPAEDVWRTLPPAMAAWKCDMTQVEMCEAKATR